MTKTDPAARAVVAKGSTIRIFYATGNVKVPDNLVGQDWALAAVALQNAGLQPRKETVESAKTPTRCFRRPRPATSSRWAPPSPSRSPRRRRPAP